MKTLKFDRELADLIIARGKYSTWRLNDDKDLRANEIVSLVRRPELVEFARAKILWVKETTFASLTEEDWEGHEKFENNEAMFNTYENYYKQKVGPGTVLKIVRFELVQK